MSGIRNKNTGKNMPSPIVFKGKVGQPFSEMPQYKKIKDPGSTMDFAGDVQNSTIHGTIELGAEKAKKRHKLHAGKTKSMNEIVFPHKMKA